LQQEAVHRTLQAKDAKVLTNEYYNQHHFLSWLGYFTFQMESDNFPNFPNGKLTFQNEKLFSITYFPFAKLFSVWHVPDISRIELPSLQSLDNQVVLFCYEILIVCSFSKRKITA